MGTAGGGGDVAGAGEDGGFIDSRGGAFNAEIYDVVSGGEGEIRV